MVKREKRDREDVIRTGLGSYMDYVITIRWCGCDIYNGNDKAPKA